MKPFKLFIITFFIIFSSLTGITYAESLKFDAATYEGEVKGKGEKIKAHGVGTFTFSDGSKYVGKVSKNRIHGKGKYTDAQGKVYEGKFRYGTLKMKINETTRSVIKIKPKTGLIESTEMKGTGNMTKTRYFEAEKTSSGYQLTKKGKMDMDAMEKSGEAGASGGSSGGCGG
mgnify:CR=1 FL=1|jgi:hypothetical protein